jgi:hypothetical protein
MTKNRYFKKTLTVILSVILILLSISPVYAVDIENELVYEYVGGEEYNLYDQTRPTNAQMQNYLASSNENVVTSYTGYSLLSDIEKEFYDRVLTTPASALEFTINYTPYLTREQFNAIDFTAIMYAICLDHPEIFYYNGYGYGYSYVPSTGAVASIRYKIVSPTVQGTSTPVYTSANIISCKNKMWTEFNRVATELDLANCTRQTFVKTLHDYLCNSVDYVINNKSCFDPYGTLVEKEAVCQGYSETFKMFCDYFGIPCISITGNAGGPHMWNAVQMEDGNWYILDITWDDQYKIFYDFYLIGLNTKDTNFTAKPFRESHVSDAMTYLPAINISTTAYVQKDESLFNATYNSITSDKNNLLFVSIFDVENNPVYYNGHKIEIDYYCTGSEFTTPDNETWELVVMGDSSGDGFLDIDDYQCSVNKALSEDHAVHTPSDYAADVCYDGYIDVLDVFYLSRMVYGHDTDLDLSGVKIE